MSSALGTRKPRGKPIKSGLEAELAFQGVFGKKASVVANPDGPDPFKGLDKAFKKLEEPKT